MIMRQSYLEDVTELLRDEPDETFKNAPLSKQEILDDKDRMERLWALYQKGIEEYGCDAAYSYGDAMNDAFGIKVHGWPGESEN